MEVVVENGVSVHGVNVAERVVGLRAGQESSAADNRLSEGHGVGEQSPLLQGEGGDAGHGETMKMSFRDMVMGDVGQDS
ncbi:hypothetical protein V6N13_050358 [Hibiscus sabdariffa]